MLTETTKGKFGTFEMERAAYYVLLQQKLNKVPFDGPYHPVNKFNIDVTNNVLAIGMIELTFGGFLTESKSGLIPNYRFFGRMHIDDFAIAGWERSAYHRTKQEWIMRLDPSMKLDSFHVDKKELPNPTAQKSWYRFWEEVDRMKMNAQRLSQELNKEQSQMDLQAFLNKRKIALSAREDLDRGISKLYHDFLISRGWQLEFSTKSEGFPDQYNFKYKSNGVECFVTMNLYRAVDFTLAIIEQVTPR